MPLPYPEAFRGGPQRSSKPLWQKRAVCLQALVLDWLVLDCPRLVPQELRCGAKLSAKQWTVVGRLEFLSWDRNTPADIDPELMGRAASKIEAFDRELGAIHRIGALLTDRVSAYFSVRPAKFKDRWFDPDCLRCGSLLNDESIDGRDQFTAKSIVASRLVFPEPPAFEPQEFMDPKTATIFDCPIDHATPVHRILEPVPRVRVRATNPEKLDLYKKLALSGRLQPVLASQTRAGLGAGVFSVGKSIDKDRLILDARPANIAELKLHHWTHAMASASLLSDIILQDDQVLISSGEDLRDFFYQFKNSQQRLARNFLCSQISIREARYVFGDDFEWSADPVWCSLATLGMGDCNACEYAQSSHLGFCLRHGVATPGELITLKTDMPRGLLSIGIIIDDLVVLEKVAREIGLAANGKHHSTGSDVRLDRALAGYASVRLERNPKKEFRNCLQARFWGCELDVEKGTLRPSSLRLWPIIFITSRVASLGLCSVGLLEALAGSWVSLFSIRRRFLCVMDLMFDPLSISDQTKVFRLSSELIDELWTVCVLGPLAFANLRAQPVSFLTATDASNGGLR